jgi:hypothetical protein
MADVTLILKANNSDYVNKMKESQKETQKVYDTSQRGGKQEKGILTEIEQRLDALNKKRKAAFSYEDIAKYNKQIQETKLNLEEYEKAGMKTEKTGQSFIGTLGKWAAGFVTVSAALKVFKSMMESTESTASKLEGVIKGATVGVNYFFKTIASGDWEGFRKGLRDSVEAGKKFVEDMDDISNRRNEFLIVSTEREAKIAELRDKTFNKDKANNAERKKALEDMIVLEDQNFADKSKITIDAFNKTVAMTAKQNKLTDEEVKAFVSKYSTFKDYLELGKRWSVEFAVMRDKMSQAQIEEAMEASKFATQYGKLTKEEKANIAQLWADISKDVIENGQRVRKNETQLAGVINEMEKDKLDAIKEADKKKKEELKKYYDWVFEYAIAEEKRLNDAMNKLKDSYKDIAPVRASGEYETTSFDMFTSDKGQKDYLSKMQSWAKTKAAINNTIEDDNKKRTDAEKKDWEEKVKIVKDSIAQIESSLQSLFDMQYEDAQRERDLLDTRVSELEQSLQTELSLKKEGYASNVNQKKAELQKMQVLREQALQKEEEALKRKRQMEAISQGIDIASTIISGISKAVKREGWWGLIEAASGIIAMFALINSSKSKISSATQLAEGGSGTDTGIITGRSHSQGGERFLNHLEVERGEAWGVLSIPATRKYGKVFHSMVSSFNKGELPSIIPINEISSNNNVLVNNDGSNSRLDKLISENKKLNAKLGTESFQDLGDRIVIKKGNTTTTIRR